VRKILTSRNLVALKVRAPKPVAHAPQPQLRLQEERVTELFDVSVEEFLEHGFEGASINRIVRRANASKTTFYSRFPTKEKLFLAVLEYRMNFVFREVSSTLPLDPPLGRSLREWGVQLANLILSEEHIGLLRVVSMEAQRFPELGRRFYELGPKRGYTLLAGYFKEQVRRGRVANESPELMAEHYLSLLSGGGLRWGVLGLKQRMTAEDISRHVDAAVKAFLRAYAP
jgi:TetR/AcrR family transcriptional regulator, mexJK operon transcriptional repressor